MTRTKKLAVVGGLVLLALFTPAAVSLAHAEGEGDGRPNARVTIWQYCTLCAWTCNCQILPPIYIT